MKDLLILIFCAAVIAYLGLAIFTAEALFRRAMRDDQEKRKSPR